LRPYPVSLSPVFARVVLLLALCVPAPAAVAQVTERQRPGDEAFYGGADLWQEGKAVFPPVPGEGALVQLPAKGVQVGYGYAIDLASLSLGRDGVTRYTVVIRSPADAESIFYEGIRCTTGEYKPYGFAAGNQRFKPINDPQWRALRRSRGAFGYRRLIGRGLFMRCLGPSCQGAGTDQAPEAIRAGQYCHPPPMGPVMPWSPGMFCRCCCLCRGAPCADVRP